VPLRRFLEQRAAEHAQATSEALVDSAPPIGTPGRPLGKRPYPASGGDRQQSCPFLIRAFVKFNAPIREEDFNASRLDNAGQEYPLHAWRDSTLRELADLLCHPLPAARRWGVRIHFASVFADRRGHRSARELGVVNRSQRSRDDFRTLEQARFQIGDWMAVAVIDSSSGGGDVPSAAAVAADSTAATPAPAAGAAAGSALAAAAEAAGAAAENGVASAEQASPTPRASPPNTMHDD